MSTTATNQIMEQEAQALAELLVSGERCALVIVMWLHDKLKRKD